MHMAREYTISKGKQNFPYPTDLRVGYRGRSSKLNTYTLDFAERHKSFGSVVHHDGAA